MSRAAVAVRRIEPEGGALLEPFLGLWTEALVEGGVSQEAASRAAAEGRVSTALARPDVRAYGAVGDGGMVGFILLAQTPFSGLVDAPTVVVDQLYVLKEHRRHGVGKQLLCAATAFADSLGCEQVLSSVPVHDREANRFFARLGFSGQVVRRGVSTSALRRRLNADQGGSRSLDQLLQQRRRSLRLRGAQRPHGIAG